MSYPKKSGSLLTIWGLSLLILAIFFLMFQLEAQGFSFFIMIVIIILALAIIDIHAWRMYKNIDEKDKKKSDHNE